MAYEIIISPAALRHLKHYTSRNRKRVLDELERQLKNEPAAETRRRKPLRPNDLADWELRVGNFRAFYKIVEDDKQVVVVAVGEKVRERVMIGGKEWKL